MFEYSERELKFLNKWIKEIMDVRMDYEILEPEIKNGADIIEGEIYIKIITDSGCYKNRICMSLQMLRFCVREDLFD